MNTGILKGIDRRSMDRLLRPRSVVIVGASPTPGALGASVLGNLRRNGFAGDIYLINPKRDQIDGLPCLPSIADLPMGVDAAVLAIPRAAVLDSVRALAQRGVGAAIIFSAGFAEDGEAGMAAQAEIAAVAAKAGMVVEGPNCLGMVNFVDGVALTFVETDATKRPEGPGIALVSQSGAMAAVVSVTLRGRDLPLSFTISTGNEAASGVEDYVDYMIADDRTSVIGMIVEQFRKPARFLELAERARAAGKTIVLLHPGRSGAARASAATHTGALAGDYDLMRTKVERAGVVLVDNLEELGDVLDLAHRCRAKPTPGTAVITESGAFKALTLDLCDQIGLDLPTLTNTDIPALREAMPEFIPVTNPLDLTAQALVDPDLYRRTLAAVLGDDRFGSVVLGIIQTDPATSNLKFPPIIQAIEALKPTKPVIFAGLDDGAEVPKDYIARLRALGVPYFPSPDRVFRALAHLTALSRRDFAAAPPDTGNPPALPPAAVIPEHRAKALLAPLGIPFPAGRMATTLDQAKAAARDLGYPVVIKAQAEDLPHKSDAGGVIVGIRDEAALAEGWARIQADLDRNRPGLQLDGILVEKMGARGIELIVGARNDPDWGPVVLVGFGGVTAEVLHDVRLLPPDLTEEAIVREIGKLRSAALLHGFRGAPPADVAAVARIVAALGRLVLAAPAIREIDLNPVMALPQGQGAVALDALIYTT